METSDISAGWTEQQMAYARFQAANKVDANMVKWTEEEYAKATGITDRTLRSWKHLPGFWQLVSELVPDTLHKYIPAMMQVQVKKALEGTNDSLRLVLNQADRLKSEKQQVEHEMGENMMDVFGMMREKARIIDGDFTEANTGANPVDGGERTANLPTGS